MLITQLKCINCFRKTQRSLFLKVLGSQRLVTLKKQFSYPYSTKKSVAYVDRVRQLEHLKLNSADCLKAFSSGKYVLFRGPSVLVDTQLLNLLSEYLPTDSSGFKADDLNGKYSMVWVEYEDVLSLLEYARAESEQFVTSSSVLVGIDEGGGPLFALEMPSTEHKSEDQILKGLNAGFLRMGVAIFYTKFMNGVSLYGARTLLRWHNYNKHCSKCGGCLIRNVAGTQASCSTCKKVQYPKADPVALALVIEEANQRCLLVRKAKFPRGMYSAISGFMDIGESLEETVHREVAEEVGLEVMRTEYISSQPWPLLGATFLLGCLAYVRPGQTMSLDTKELQEARWFSRGELCAAYDNIAQHPMLMLGMNAKKNGQIWVPPNPSLANLLVERFLELYK